MTRLRLHRENHLVQRVGGLRAAVLGANDGIVSTASLIVGVAGHRSVRTGEFRDDLDPDDAAFLVIGLVQGLALRWSLSRRTFGLIEEGSHLLELQIRGFARTLVTETRESRLA